MALFDFISDIAWPLVVLAGGYYFRKEIRAALERVIELGPSGVKLDHAKPVQVATAPPAAAANELISNIKQFISPDQIDPSVDAIRIDLQQRSSNKDEQVDMLVHALAAVNIQLGHERAYGAIFGSQIVALARMNEVGGASDETLKQIYAAAAANHAEFYKTYSYESWVEFLFKSGLAIRNGAIYKTTPYGSGFLKYILDRHLTVAKPY